MALSMTMNGAAGETLEEMKEALWAKNFSVEAINKYNKSLREALLKVDPTTAISIANAIWYRNTLTVKADFITVNKNCYDAEVKALDFNTPNAANQINSWVSDKTNKKIPTIIQQIKADDMMYLINAVYFKGIWKSKFDKNNTKDEDFYPENPANNADSYKVSMMKQTETFSYSEDDNCRYLRMAYGNKAFSMVVMLPHEGKTVGDVIANLNSESWNKAMRMGTVEVNLRFPRFKTECEYEMKESILPAMGMHIPFSENANFSGISDFPLLISKVIHKTFVEVNEEGTEAAAVTAVVMAPTSVGPGTIIDYAVNKPFAFAICENSTGVILFIGKINEIK
jgi:serpin B